MCQKKKAEGLDKESTCQGPAKARPATAQGQQPEHSCTENREHSTFMGDHSKNTKPLKQRNLFPLLLVLGVTLVIYVESGITNFCKMGGMP